MKYTILLAMAVALVGCQTADEVRISYEQGRPASSAIKSQIVRDARDYLVDPYSIRDAEISFMQFNNRSGLHWLCVKANAKNRMGGYVGRQAIEVWVRDGKLAGNVPNSPACNSSSLRWQAFPELEALRNL